MGRQDLSMSIRPLGAPARLAVILALGLPLIPSRTSAQPPPADSSFVSLFNGHDLSGWDGNPKLWSVEGGAITGRRVIAEKPDKGNTFLIWKGGRPANFELRASFRLLSDNATGWANSGIQYRSRIVDPEHWVVRGYQADMDGSGKYVGQLYEEGYRGFLALPGQRVRVTSGGAKPRIQVLGTTAEPSAILASIRRRGWNEYVIIAEGTQLRQYFNGTLTADVTDLDEPNAAKSGVIALQLHAGLPMTVQFKDILLKLLP
jgi:hypothetical protein